MDLVRTDSQQDDFKALVALLDAELAVRDGEEHAFYHAFNGIAHLQHVIVCYWEEKPVSCGAFKPFEGNSVEIKRMYTLPEYRGKGIASRVLKDLEDWSKELGFTSCVLETGKKQPEAIRLYQKNGYILMENYGQYKGVENSLCFQKKTVGK